MATFKRDILGFISYSAVNCSTPAKMHSRHSHLIKKGKFGITIEGEPSTLFAKLEMKATNNISTLETLETLQNKCGDKPCVIEAHWRKLPIFDQEKDVFTHSNQFVVKMEIHTRKLEAQNKNTKGVRDVLTLIWWKIYGRYETRVSQRSQTTTWIFDDFLTALKRELQQEVSSIKKLQHPLTAATYTNHRKKSKPTQKRKWNKRLARTNKRNPHRRECLFCESWYRPRSYLEWTNVNELLE